MKRTKLLGRVKLTLLFLLVLLAVASAYTAMRPLVYRAEKAKEIRRETQDFYTAALNAAQQEPDEVPYLDLLQDFQIHNEWLYEVKQGNLTGPDSYEESIFDLTDYGLPDQTFGVISIPKMELEMPLYLGASYENMANGAAVLSQTSIPIGGNNTNSVIAGHRGWQGYDYFKQIELLETGDEVTITNLWGTLIYKVREIKIISPDDIESILIQPGKDMITLLTCHPYASGGKYRYLVYCDRATEPTNPGGEKTNVLLP